MKWRYITRWMLDRPHKIGTLLNQNKVEKTLGLGAYGIIYLCTETGTDKPYVVKQLRPSKRKKERERERFKRETQFLRNIDHPSIPALVDEFMIEGGLYYVMEYVEGDNLEELLFLYDQEYTELEALSMMKQLLSIISSLHQQRIFHTDIRPPNVIICQEKVYLLDFGLAIQVDGDNENEMNHYRQDDYYDFGQMILFLLYSQFHGKRSRKLTWLDELTLHPATVLLLKRLLGISEPYSNMREIEEDLQSAIAFFQGEPS